MIIVESHLRRIINEELQIVLLEQRLELFEHEAKRDVDKLLREVELQDPDFLMSGQPMGRPIPWRRKQEMGSLLLNPMRALIY